MDGATVGLPFDPGEVAENFRRERYAAGFAGGRGIWGEAVRKAYYLARPLMPVSMRKHMQKTRLRGWEKVQFPRWPVDAAVDDLVRRLFNLSLRVNDLKEVPFIWFWPDGCPSCGIMTHDVETSSGRDFCPSLMDLNDSFGIKSSFQVVPEKRYSVPQSFLDGIRERGFEVNIHDLNHDGHLFANEAEFRRRARRINDYARQYDARGFRSGVLYRNADWYDALEFSYDMSIPSVAHLDPQRGGCCTVMPYFIDNVLELPVTTTQDYSLFHILGDYSTELWKKQTDIIMGHHGLVSFIVHPDYLIPEPARRTYSALLEHLAQLRADRRIWLALPRQVDTWWRQRSHMTLAWAGGEWRVEGVGKERARVAFAAVDGDTVSYRLGAPDIVRAPFSGTGVSVGNTSCR
jgi:hypothetical protein